MVTKFNSMEDAVLFFNKEIKNYIESVVPKKVDGVELKTTSHVKPMRMYSGCMSAEPDHLAVYFSIFVSSVAAGCTYDGTSWTKYYDRQMLLCGHSTEFFKKDLEEHLDNVLKDAIKVAKAERRYRDGQQKETFKYEHV